MKENTSQSLRAVFVIAHPDDEAIALGLPRTLVEKGVDVEIIALTKGDAGSHTIRSRRQLSRIRKEEFTYAGKILGARTHVLGFSDGRLDEQIKRARSKLLKKMQKRNPDIVIVHHPEDYHSDHRAAHDIGIWAAFHMPDSTRRLGFSKRRRTAKPVSAVYSMDTQGSQTWNSSLMDIGGNENQLSSVGMIVEVSEEQIAKSMESFLSHTSQFTKRAEGLSYPELAVLGARRRGKQAGFSYGVGLTQVSFGGYAFPTKNILTETVGLQAHSTTPSL